MVAERTEEVILAELHEVTERLTRILAEPRDFNSTDEEFRHIFDYAQHLGRAREDQSRLHNELATMFAAGCIFVFVQRDHLGPEVTHVSLRYPSYAKGMRFQMTASDKLEIANHNITCTHPIESGDCLIRGPRGVYIFFFHDPDIDKMRELVSSEATDLLR